MTKPMILSITLHYVIMINVSDYVTEGRFTLMSGVLQ